MKTTKRFNFDETRRAEKLLSEGFEITGFVNFSDVFLVLKYFRQTLGYGKTRLEKEAVRICKEQDPLFNEIVNSRAIKDIVNSVMRSKGIRKSTKIPLTKKEIEFISSEPLLIIKTDSIPPTHHGKMLKSP